MLPPRTPPQAVGDTSSNGSGDQRSLSMAGYIKSIREELRSNNLKSALSVSTRAMDELSSASVVERTRLFLLRSEVYSQLGNGAQSVAFAEKALASSDCKSAHAYLILGREHFLSGKVQESVAAFEMAESLIENDISDLKQVRTDADVLAEVGIDPSFLRSDSPVGGSPTFRQTVTYRGEQVVPPESDETDDGSDADQEKESQVQKSAADQDDDPAFRRKVSIDAASIERQETRRTFEHAVNMRAFRQFRRDAVAVYTFLSNRIIEISVSHDSLLRHAMRRRPQFTREVHVRIRNLSEIPLVHAFERVESAKFLPDLRLPHQIPHGFVAVGGIEADSGLMWGQKAFVAIMGYSLGVPPASSSSSKATPSTPSPNASSPEKKKAAEAVEPTTVVLFRVEKTMTGILKFGVRVEPISSMKDKRRMQEILDNSAAASTKKTANGSVAVAASGRDGGEGGVLFTPTCYCTFNRQHYMVCATYPSKLTRAFSVIKIRKAISHVDKVCLTAPPQGMEGAVTNGGNSPLSNSTSSIGNPMTSDGLPTTTVVDKRTIVATSNSLNDVDLLNVFEYLPATHRYKAACLSTHCRNIAMGLPPTACYVGEFGTHAESGQTSISNSAAWQWLQHSDGHTFPPRATFPAYALRNDFFHNPFIVREKEPVDLRLLLERNALLLVNNENHIVFEFSSPGTGTTTGRMFYGPHRCTQVLTLVESLVPLVETVTISSAAHGEERIAQLEFPREDMGIVRLQPVFEDISPATGRRISSANPVDQVPGREISLALPLYTLRRRFVPGGKVLDQLQVQRTGNPNPCAHFRRQSSNSFRSQVGIATFEEGADVLMCFAQIAYGYYKWAQRT